VKKKIAFFDFDGTITTKDSFVEFLKFTQGRRKFYIGFLKNAFYLVAYKLKLIPNQKAKEKVLEYFFRNTAAENFDALCKNFSQKVLPSLIRPKAVREIKMLQEKGFIVVVVSASPENWIKPWTESMGLALIATCLETNSGTITGKLNGKNCRGQEKVRRILELHQMHDYDEIYAYGDSSGDRQMMKLATRSFYKPFRK
jgi:phosphatidylglycerophosphatase C